MSHDDRAGRFVPTASSWLSAVLLYGAFFAWSFVAAVVLPSILAMFEEAPRLAALSGAGLLLSPAILVAMVHHTVHGLLDGLDGARGTMRFFPGAASAWAGLFGWGVMVLATGLSALLLLAVFPIERSLGTALHLLARPHAGAPQVMALLHLALWLSIAAKGYDLEKKMKAAVAKGEPRV